MNILDEIIEHKKKEVAERKGVLPLKDIQAALGKKEPAAVGRFKAALDAAGPRLIAELKRRSPSAGVIREDFRPVELASELEQGGADALSVLTDRKYFGGGPEVLRQAVTSCKLPVLLKDFVIDEYQVYEAALWGAAAFLLLASQHDAAALERYAELGEVLGLNALVEVHDEKEMRQAVKTGAKMIGINNRDLKDFSVDIETSARLAASCPEGTSIVSESGIKSAAVIERLSAAGVDAFLIGEELMRAEDVGVKIRELFAHKREG